MMVTRRNKLDGIYPRHGLDYLDIEMCTRPYTTISRRKEDEVRTFLKEGYLCRYKVSHMNIDSIDHSSVH
jgi:hypothetical protein